MHLADNVGSGAHKPSVAGVSIRVVRDSSVGLDPIQDLGGDELSDGELGDPNEELLTVLDRDR